MIIIARLNHLVHLQCHKFIMKFEIINVARLANERTSGRISKLFVVISLLWPFCIPSFSHIIHWATAVGLFRICFVSPMKATFHLISGMEADFC